MTARVTVVPRSRASSLASRSASAFLMLSAMNTSCYEERYILPSCWPPPGIRPRHEGSELHGGALRRRAISDNPVRETVAPVAGESRERRRTVADLRARAATIRRERETAAAERREAERRQQAKLEEKARRVRLDALAARGAASVWRGVETEIERRNAAGYERAKLEECCSGGRRRRPAAVRLGVRAADREPIAMEARAACHFGQSGSSETNQVCGQGDFTLSGSEGLTGTLPSPMGDSLSDKRGHSGVGCRAAVPERTRAAVSQRTGRCSADRQTAGCGDAP